MREDYSSRAAIRQKPQAALQRALGFFHSGNTASALALCKNIVISAPNYTNGWLLLAQLQLDIGRADRAQQCAEQALTLAPSNHRASLLLSESLVANNQRQHAKKVLEALESQAKNNAPSLRMAANVYAGMLCYDSAGRCYRRALELEPNHLETWHLYSGALFAQGSLDEAETALNTVLRLNPLHGEALLTRSNMSTQSAGHNHVSELNTILDQERLSGDDRAMLLFALAKELEDIGEYSRSFTHLQQGAEEKDPQLNYDVGKDVEFMASLTSRFADTIANKPRDETLGRGLIFIVSLPRSGSTLVDRILSSHSAIKSAGETDAFHKLLIEHARRASAQKKMTLIEAICQIDYPSLGREYMAGSNTLAGDAPLVIDKTPGNLQYLGLIHQALPSAKIVHVHKSPMDACYSVYKTLFNRGYGYSYNLEKLGQFYIAYREMMREWRQQLPEAFLDVSYEQLLTHQEQQTRRLLGHCDLDWQQQCMDFHLNASPTATASVVQVRQPLFHTSVEKWRCYEEQLAPLADKLRQAGLHIDSELP